MVKVEIVYVTRDKHVVTRVVELESGATVADALEISGIGQDYPETRELPVGIFSKMTKRDRVVKQGDRIEIYRPLLIDPKEKRRQRAKS
jgi:putative ubiquitin-RnfH superfamily antitoxin RatB of RatAB toxin-antitoxin module